MSSFNLGQLLPQLHCPPLIADLSFPAPLCWLALIHICLTLCRHVHLYSLRELNSLKSPEPSPHASCTSRKPFWFTSDSFCLCSLSIIYVDTSYSNKSSSKMSVPALKFESRQLPVSESEEKAPDSTNSMSSSIETKTWFISVPLTPASHKACHRLGAQDVLAEGVCLVPSVLGFLQDTPEQKGAPPGICFLLQPRLSAHTHLDFSAAARHGTPTCVQWPTSLYPHVVKIPLRDAPQLVPHCLWLFTPQTCFPPFTGHYFNILLF